MRIAVVVGMVALACGLGACQSVHHGAGPESSAAPAAGLPEKAHLYIYLGRVHGQIFSHANWHTAGFYVNGVDVGTVGWSDVLKFDLEPGVYDFSWRGRQDFLGADHSAHDYDMLLPGQEAYLALNIDENAGWWIPLFGWWIDPDTGYIADTFPRGRKKIAGRQPVRPSPAILAQLHPIAGPTTYLPSSW